MKVNCKGCANDDCSYFGMNNYTSCLDYKPLNLVPQQRTWVELTEEDFVCVHQLCDTPIQAAEYVNHLLKEKNNA